MTQARPALDSAPAPFTRGYAPVPDRYDEMCEAAGSVRPHWRYLLGALEALGPGELSLRRQELSRLLRENGVTYNVYDDPGNDRLWPLDAIPVLLTSNEWSAIERGLIQRAELFDLLLEDLYGPRRLVASGKVPPELVAANPGFLRPCCRSGLGPASGQRLILYAADLVRGPDGVVCVLGDRTQAPSGSGYALENRVVLSRVLPSLYRDSHVHRLALFFRALRATLHDLDPRRDDDPRIVVLTPGPENETHFEHAYLASYLGYDLVQGSDLAVRDQRVWLKTLDGPRLVDVILRRVDDEYCDPLELRPDSLLGAPGLLQAIRAGHVAVANPLGSGILESPAWLSLLPGLARELLGEELRLPSVATRWCGDPGERAYVLEHLDELVIKPIYRQTGAPTVFGTRLSRAERESLAERIRARPYLYVGQEWTPLSTAPVALDGELEPRPMVMRAFAAARDRSYVVMPGGLGRVAPSADSWLVSNQHGGVSKDIWVLASEPERQVSLLTVGGQPLAVTREGDDVPARVADDLYWLGRYTERTEDTARLLREAVLRVLAAGGPPDDDLAALLRAVTIVTGTYPGFAPVILSPSKDLILSPSKDLILSPSKDLILSPSKDLILSPSKDLILSPSKDDATSRLVNPEAELLRALLDRRAVGSLRFDIDAVVRAVRSVRDRLSSDASRVIHSINRELNRPCDLGGALEPLQRVILQLAAFAGLCGESMNRGQAWRFLEIGRTLERAVHTSTLLRAVFASSAGDSALEALLAVAHSVKTYRRRYRSRVQPGAVLDLLLLDEANPRSVGFQLMQLEKLIVELEKDGGPRRSALQRAALDALTQLRLFDVKAIGAEKAGDDALDGLLGRILKLLVDISDEIGARYFSHAAPQQLVRLV